MKKRPIDEASKLWGKAVRAVLQRARVRSAQVAEHVFGRSPGRRHTKQGKLHQNLSGIRRPNQKRVEAIVRAIGALAGSEAEVYTGAEARACGLLDADAQTRLRDGLAAFELVIGPVTLGFARRVVDAIAPLTDEARRTLLAELHRTHRKLLFKALDGRVRSELGYRALRSVCAKHRISLNVLLDEGRPGGAQEAQRNAELRVALRAAFGRYFPDSSASERFAAEKAIAQAIGVYLGGHPRIKIAERSQTVVEQVRRNRELCNDAIPSTRSRLRKGNKS